jgi:Ca2+-binding EF-hand superfamily protein
VIVEIRNLFGKLLYFNLHPEKAAIRVYAMQLNKREINKIRNIFAQYGWEYTPSQVEKIKELESLKEQFLSIKPIVQKLKEKLDRKEIDFEEFVIELGNKFGSKCSEEQCKQLIILNSCF